jgi:glutamate racemase
VLRTCDDEGLGPDVSLIDPAAEIAREVSEILRRQGIERREEREGEYSFYCTGDPESFRSVGSRFLQLPIDEVRQVPLAELQRLVAEERDVATAP